MRGFPIPSLGKNIPSASTRTFDVGDLAEVYAVISIC